MRLPKELTTVTPLSKAVALLIFLSAPLIAFLLGVKYQADLTGYVPTIENSRTACTMEARLCPNGSSVGRTGPNCEFAPCPVTGVNPQNIFCGGIAGIGCPTGYICRLDGNYPDAGGTCMKRFAR